MTKRNLIAFKVFMGFIALALPLFGMEAARIWFPQDTDSIFMFGVLTGFYMILCGCMVEIMEQHSRRKHKKD